MNRFVLCGALAAVALSVVGCAASGPAGSGPADGGQPTAAPTTGADLAGTITWTLKEVDDDQAHLGFHYTRDESIVLTIQYAETSDGHWVDAGSSYTRHGTDMSNDQLCTKNGSWESAGQFAATQDSDLIVTVDRDASQMSFDADVGAELKGTATCDPTSYGQSAGEWLEKPRCGDGDPLEQVTGDELGHIGADGRTVTVDCTSVADTVLNESGTSHIEMKLSGQLQLNR
jgi:hypothetical protein